VSLSVVTIENSETWIRLDETAFCCPQAAKRTDVAAIMNVFFITMISSKIHH